MDDAEKCPVCGGPVFEGRRVVWCRRLGCRWQRPLFTLYLESEMKRRGETDPSGVRVVPTKAAFDEQLQREYPHVAAFLCDLFWEDGEPRVPGTIMVFAEQGRFKVCLNDKAEGQVAFVTVDSPCAVLGAAEHALEDDGTDWRQSSARRR